MSVLCSRIPNLAFTLATRHQPELPSQPVALIDRDEEVCGLSTPAYQLGVRQGMSPRQAQMRCPGLTILPADLSECKSAQSVFLAEVGQWELPTEAHGMGMAYIDLHQITAEKKEAKDLASDLGRRLRRALGDDLVPSLGWDHSKFCARAAAYQTAAGKMKLVAKEDEVHFLAPLSISLLPLPVSDLQKLHWLGITTLGAFAALSPAAILQQFGKRGQVAHRWARGKDNRPVRNMLNAARECIEIDFETPTVLLGMVTDELMARLQPLLDEWVNELQGCTRLRLELCFVNCERRILDLVWLEPVSQASRLRSHLSAQLASLNWPTALDRLLITQVVTSEFSTRQMSLFDEPLVEHATLEAVAEPLKRRYGSICRRGDVIDPTHPIDERRIQIVEL